MIVLSKYKLIFIASVIIICFSVTIYAGFLQRIWSSTPQTSITFEPVGFHTTDALRGFSQGNDLNYAIGFNYKTIIAGTFINSYDNRVYYIGVNRDFFIYKRLTLNYLLGIMHGYGDDATSLGVCDPGPLLALNIRYNLIKHFDFFSSFFGAGFLFGVSYRFGS